MTKPKSEALGATGPGAFTYWGRGVLSEASKVLLAKEVARSGLLVTPFFEWLEGPLEAFRHVEDVRSDKPQLAAVAQWMQDAADALPASLDDGRFAKMPAHAEAAAYWAGNRGQEEGEDFVDYWGLVLRERRVAEVARCLRAGRESLLKQLGSGLGQPTQHHRDDLYFAVVHYLREHRIKAAAADALARVILKYLGIADLPAADSMQRSRRRRLP